MRSEATEKNMDSSEKRKREGNDDVANNKTKNAKPEEDEEEVEEFFAILKRIHVAVKYFEKVDGSGRGLTATAKTWNPSFQIEDFAGNDGAVKEQTEDYAALDLNSEPV